MLLYVSLFVLLVVLFLSALVRRKLEERKIPEEPAGTDDTEPAEMRLGE